MNTLYHFGDSFAFNDFSKESYTKGRLNEATYQDGNFGSIIAESLGLKYNFQAKTGDSNQLIFDRILSFSNHYKKGDVLLINWSFFSRGTYIKILEQKQQYQLSSTNGWFDEGILKYTNDYEAIEFFKKEYGFLMDYIINYNFDLTVKLFEGPVSHFFKTLLDKDVKIYNVFNDSFFGLNYGDKKLSYKPDGIGDILHFKAGYYQWLEMQNWLREEDGHYKKGIQNRLAKIYLTKINEFGKLI